MGMMHTEHLLIHSIIFKQSLNQIQLMFNQAHTNRSVKHHRSFGQIRLIALAQISKHGNGQDNQKATLVHLSTNVYCYSQLDTFQPWKHRIVHQQSHFFAP